MAVEQAIGLLEQVVRDVPIGTNLALFRLLWAILCGAFLQSRGAIFPALQSLGLKRAQIRRCSQALRKGVWTIDALLQPFRAAVLAQGRWQPCRYEGFHPVAGDITAFWRPRLKGRIGKFFHPLAQRAVPGVGFGLLVNVGRVGNVRIPLLRLILRAEKGINQKGLLPRLLEAAAHILMPDEVLIFDAAVSVAEVQKAGVRWYLIRGRENCTARRNPSQEARTSPRVWGTGSSPGSPIPGPDAPGHPAG